MYSKTHCHVKDMRQCQVTTLTDPVTYMLSTSVSGYSSGTQISFPKRTILLLTAMHIHRISSVLWRKLGDYCSTSRIAILLNIHHYIPVHPFWQKYVFETESDVISSDEMTFDSFSKRISVKTAVGYRRHHTNIIPTVTGIKTVSSHEH